MNNMCPSCGAIYNVAVKDIGRRIKCKKCNTALEVTESGLSVEGHSPPPPPDLRPEDDFEEESPRRRRDRRIPGLSINPTDVLGRIGGIPTLLFGFGAFLIIFTGFQDSIGKAKIARRQAAIDEGQAEVNGAQRRYDENKDKTAKDDENIKQVRENWDKKKKLLEDDKLASELANKRSAYLDKYVLMFGFLLISFGCLGYLQAEYGIVLRIVAATILVFMIMALFKVSVGASAGVNASIGLG